MSELNNIKWLSEYFFTNKIYTKALKRNYVTKKTKFYHFDDTRSLDSLILNDCDREKTVVIDIFVVKIEFLSKIERTIPWKRLRCPNHNKLFWKQSLFLQKKTKLIWIRWWKRVSEQNPYWFLSTINIRIYLRKKLPGTVLKKPSQKILQIFLTSLFSRRIKLIGWMLFP